MPITRRTVSAGMLAGFSTLASLFATPLSAADKGVRHSLLVLYPNAPDLRFDLDYYRDTHLALMRKFFGDSIGKIEIRRGLYQADGTPPLFHVSLTVEILSIDGFNAATKAHFPDLAADLPNYTNLKPVGQIERVFE